MSRGFGMDPIPGLNIPAPPPRPAPDTARLRVMNGPCAQREFAIRQTRVLIGRSDPPAITVDIDLTDCELGDPPMVSRRHAELEWVNGQLMLTDLGSTNGTEINGARLIITGRNQPSIPAPLHPGDRILLGNLELEFLIETA